MNGEQAQVALEALKAQRQERAKVDPSLARMVARLNEWFDVERLDAEPFYVSIGEREYGRPTFALKRGETDVFQSGHILYTDLYHQVRAYLNGVEALANDIGRVCHT